MKTRILSLTIALALSLAALTTPAARAACPSNFCSAGKAECLAGCPCATFYCDPVGCWSDCSCPIICLD